MHIGVNGRRLEGQRFGVGRYIEYMLKYWSRLLSPRDRVTIFVRAPFRPSDLGLSDQFTARVLSPALSGFMWENLVLPRHAAATDVLFCPSYTAPLAGGPPLVVATHSLDEAVPGAHPWWYAQSYTRWYRRSARRAKRVVVPSEWTSTAMQTHYGVGSKRIKVVPLGVDVETFRPLGDLDLLSATRRRYLGSDVPYILFVGKMSGRRNIPVLLAAFALLKKRQRFPHKLLLFGPNHEGLPLAALTAELGIGTDVVHTDGKVKGHAELVPVYAAADAFVHPTAFDATSLPVLEAFATGVPVITVRTSGIKEIAEEGALLVDEVSAESLAAALTRVLTDQALRSKLRANGLGYAHRCTWENTARRTLEIVRSVGDS
jgi:glycosyltransferase involved in cell wall biosynthesis